MEKLKYIFLFGITLGAVTSGLFSMAELNRVNTIKAKSIPVTKNAKNVGRQ